MTVTLKPLLVASTLALAAGTATATVLDFDTLTRPGDPAAVRDFFQAPYGGANFGVIPTSNPAYKLGGSWFWSRDISALSNSPSTSASTEYPVDANGVPIVGSPTQQSEKVRFTGGNVNFIGAWFKGLDVIDVRFHLFLNDIDIWQSAFATLNDGTAGGAAVFLASGYAGPVDAVTVEGYQGYFAMDDFTFNAVSVPEPGSIGLALLALGGLLATARRRGQRHA